MNGSVIVPRYGTPQTLEGFGKSRYFRIGTDDFGKRSQFMRRHQFIKRQGLLQQIQRFVRHDCRGC